MSETEKNGPGNSPGPGVTRRTAAAAGLAAMIVPRRVLGGPGYQPPSDTLTIAAVGVGGEGRVYLRQCASERVVALCDVDPEGYAARTFKAYPKAARYRDYREMLDKEKGVDAVIIAVPDHSHAMVLMAALQARKHIYCAKPLTHTLHELRTVLAAERQAKVATQMSVQSCASEAACTTAEILMSGAIGAVREVHLWTDHPWEPAALRRPAETPQAPPGLDWDKWIGPAPYRPYHPMYHPWNWRAWWDFGEGTVGDMACHMLHVFHDALKLGPPTAVYGSRSTMREGLFRVTAAPDFADILPTRVETPETESYSNTVVGDFAERQGLPPLRVHWYDGGMRPPRPMGMSASIPMLAEGSMYVGDKGVLLPHGREGFVLLPENKFRDFTPPPKTLPRSIGHYREWIEAAKGGKPANCPFQFGGKLVEIALLGAIAARTARYLEWDSANFAIANDREAQALVNPPYRSGYAL
jgi:predicted dehydrogenase